MFACILTKILNRCVKVETACEEQPDIRREITSSLTSLGSLLFNLVFPNT